MSRSQPMPPPAKNDAPVDFDTIYRLHGRAVARWIARLGGPAITVEDLLQEVFLAVSRQLPGFRGDAKLTTWLFSITHHTVGNWRRRERWRRLFSRLTAHIADTTSAPQPTPAEAVERRQAGDRFYRILDALPEGQRTLLVLFEIEAQTAAEIGELLSMRPATVRVRLHRARAAFLKHMEALEAAERASTTAAVDREAAR